MHSLDTSKALLNLSKASFWVGVATALLLGCSGTSTSENCTATSPGSCGTGGSVGNGGNGSTGGAASVGGAPSSGGASTQDGNANTGGLNSSGGTSAVASSTGGVAQTGGANGTGGNVAATGGLAATGGKSATGGLAATGGSVAATGGLASATGGKSATGGTAPTGGKSATGGAAPTGGKSATGGSTGTAGGTSTSTTCTGTHTNPLSQALIDQFVTAHNNARSGTLNPTPNPALPPVTWDCILADSAYNYLAACPGGAVSLAPHNANRSTDYQALGGTGYVGENIYASTGTATPQAAVTAWMSEASAYDYNTNNIGAAGHYTQVVWRASIRIGCAIVSCSNYTYRNTILCDYSPGGNITTQKPY